MKHYIEHNSFVDFYNKDKNIFKRLFKDTKKLSTVINKIIKESKNWKKFGYKEKNKETGIIDPLINANNMAGELFEIYCELFFKILGCYRKIGVYNYKPEQEDDCGVDASGIGMNDKPLTIQCKFRRNNEKELTEGDLHQFWGQSLVRFNVEKDDRNNLVVFTSAKGLHFFTDGKVFLNRVRTVGYDDIRKNVDNNNPFWNELNDYIKKTIKKSY